MLLHGWVQDSEEWEFEAEKQGRYYTLESESMPKPQRFETLIPLLGRLPSPWPFTSNPEQWDIPKETGEESCPVWISFSAVSRMTPIWKSIQPLHAQQRLSEQMLTVWLAVGVWSTTLNLSVSRTFRCKNDLALLRLIVMPAVYKHLYLIKYVCQTLWLHSCKLLHLLKVHDNRNNVVK